jgi:hypothetical protein
METQLMRGDWERVLGFSDSRRENENFEESLEW